jgi:hypothetical protein
MSGRISAAIAVALLFVTSGVAAASHDYHDMTWDYLQKHKDGIVFVSSCRLSPIHKVVVIIPSGESKGWYATIQDDGMSISYGEVDVEKGKWHAWGFSGGIVDQKPNERLAEFLMRNSFRALPASDFYKVFEDTPSVRCPKN